MQDLIGFIIIIVLLFIMWAMLGGPARPQSEDGKFIKPSGEVYDEQIRVREIVPGSSLPIFKQQEKNTQPRQY